MPPDDPLFPFEGAEEPALGDAPAAGEELSLGEELPLGDAPAEGSDVPDLDNIHTAAPATRTTTTTLATMPMMSGVFDFPPCWGAPCG